MIQVFCKNTGTSKDFIEGTTLQEILKSFDFDQPYRIVSAKVNNVSQGLRYRLFNSRNIEFVDIRDDSGMRVYDRSLSFLLYKASIEVFPGSKIRMEHPISNGCFCYLIKQDKSRTTAEDIARIKDRMWEIVKEDVAFHRREVTLEKAIEIFRDADQEDKVKLLETSGEVYMDYYLLGDTPDYYYGRLVPSAGYLTVWDIVPYQNGILIKYPDKHQPDQLLPMVEMPKTLEAFAENLRWNNIMKLRTVGDVNHACLKGNASELIQVSEALQEKKIVQIAEEIDRRFRQKENPVKVVLITGPSSSGKTTFCKRLSIQLKACGLRPVSFSTDDYFVNRIDTPKLPDGTYDFDNFETVDHAALERDVLDLLAGKTVEVPEYNFVTGKREYNGKQMRLAPYTVLLIEGIHALNPMLLPRVPDVNKYRIFISTLTSIALDDHNWIPTSDNRLLRRIIRDYNKGAFTARETISQWQSVCDAEEKWISPYREEADAMFNSALFIEFAVLRNHAEPILATVPKNCPEYSETHRLLKFIHYFTAVSDKEIPPTSLLREFVGGSSFKY